MLPDPSTYPEAREYREAHAWWSTDGLRVPEEIGEHMHLGMWWPRHDVVLSPTKPLQLHCKLLVHHGDDDLHHFLTRWRVNWRPLPYSNESGGGALIDDATPGKWDIELDDHGSGERIFPITLNLSKLAGGTRRVRFNVMAGKDPDRFFVACDWLLNVGKRTATTGLKVIGKGWYSEPHEYQHSIFNGTPPTQPVSGKWTVNVAMNPGGGGEPTKEHFVLVDPNTHDHNLGTIVKRGTGRFSGSVTVDTTKLANGPHVLSLICHDGKLAAQQNVYFTVAN